MFLSLDDVNELELDLLPLRNKILGFGDAYLIIQKENVAQRLRGTGTRGTCAGGDRTERFVDLEKGVSEAEQWR